LKQLFPDLKAAFTEKEKEKKSASSEADEAAEKAKEEAKKQIKFIDAKDAQNMGIALSKFKTIIPDFKERRFVSLREALDRMDEVAIGGNDGIDIIEGQLPRPGNDDKAKESQEKYKKNMEEARTFSEEDSLRMALPENFLYEMSKVKRFEVRVKCLKLKNNFTEMEAAVRKDLTIFSSACADVLENKNLPVFLVDVVRPFGNELNRANGKKEATGIKISGLMKLAGTKTADNTMTSLYYIVTVLEKHRKELLDLVNEFKNVPAAMKLSMNGTEGNLKACTKAKVDLLQAVADAKKDNDEVFLSAIGPFAALVEKNVNLLESDMAKLKENILLTASYLGEKDKSDTIDAVNKPETLFKAWWDFVDVLLKTIQEFRKKEADKEKKAKEAREKEEAKMKKELAAMQKAEKAKKKGGEGGGEATPSAADEESSNNNAKEKKPRRQVKKPTAT
jgi:dishevelled associated activator of morphogenesis